MFPERIKTDRLVLERLCHENLDLFEFYEICSDADGEEDMDDVTRYMPWEPHKTVNESKEFIDQAEKRWNDGEGTAYVIRPRESEDGTGEYAGNAALHTDWDRRTGRLGTWLRKKFWGRGYSGERAAALMKIAFEHLDLEVIAVTRRTKSRDGPLRSTSRPTADAMGDCSETGCPTTRRWQMSTDTPSRARSTTRRRGEL